MDRKWIRWLCAGGFAVICVAAALFLRTFMTTSEPVSYITFGSAFRVGEDGGLTPCALDEYGTVTGMEDGAVYRFLAAVENIPDNGYLVLETAGVALTVRMDDETVLQSAGTASYGMQTLSTGQVHVPFPPGAERCALEIDCQVLDPDNALYPPLARVTSAQLQDSSNMAYANLYGIPAGGFTLIFVLVCGIFLLGLAQGAPDFTLPVLMLASGLLSVYQISNGCGYYFLPEALNRFLTWRGFFLLSPLALLVWLLLRRKQGTLRQLGWITLAVGSVTLCVYLISLARGSYFAQYINGIIADPFRYGSYVRPVYWLTVYLTAASAAVSAYGLLNSFAQMRADARTLALKNELTGSSYRAAEEKLRQNAAMRHEWKNQVAALHLLQQQGDLAALGRYLEELDGRLDRLAPRQYTEHFTINTILQNAAARAEELGVEFRAAAQVPPGLNIDTGDLCCLLLNLLDNALEAASRVPAPGAREAECIIKVKQGYLAVKCENTYTAPLSLDEQGRLLTTRADRDGHGFGMAQMKAIAKKYGSVVDVSYTDDRFTVQTALKIK